MNLEKISRKSLKIYELFGKDDNQDFYAIHTLDKLYLDIYKNEIKDLKKIKPYLSSFTIHPYLMLKNLDNRESEIIKLISQNILNLWKNGKFNSNVIQKLENPPSNKKFMKHLLSAITSERSNERFHEKEKAKKLFFLYVEKKHLKLMMEDLELHADLYNGFGHSEGSDDD